MFARPSTASWDSVPYTEGANGCALFADVLAHLECSNAMRRLTVAIIVLFLAR